MNPSIFENSATRFISNGIGVLRDVISCEVVEQLNGDFSLTMQLLTSDKYYDYIQVGNIISAKPNLYMPNQAFVIETIEKNIDGVVDIYASHISQHRAKLIPVAPFSAVSLSEAISKIKQFSRENNPFILTTNKTSTAKVNQIIPKSFRECLGGSENSLLDIYGGEYLFNNFEISLLKRRGTNTNVQILYGQNMTELNVDDEFSFDTSITGVLPFWQNEEDGVVVGDIQYASNANSFAYKKTIVIDLSSDFESKPTKTQLNNKALTIIEKRGVNLRNITVSFAQLDDNQSRLIQLGDTVTVLFSLYNVKFQSRIIETNFDVLLETYNSMIIGDKKSTINDAIANITTNSIYSVEAEIERLQNNKVSKTGDTMSGNLLLQPNVADVESIDSAGFQYPLIRENGTNIWIGAKQTQARHHTGRTVLSSGYDSANGKGFESICVAIPNDNNDNASVYDIWHKGNLLTATISRNGIMTKEDKTALDSIYSDATNQNIINRTGVVLNGYVTSSAKQIVFLIPFNVIGGNATLKSLNCGIRLGTGGYPYVRSSSNGATYTQLQNNTQMISNGNAVRSNEISSISIDVKKGIGFLVSITFVNAMTSNTAGTAIVNNQTISLLANFEILLA